MKGDFLGFSFDGIHSSRLGITRVSEGDRYNEPLVPEIEDKIIAVPGRDGSYYFGSNYRNKSIILNIAFDSVTESQFRQIRKLFATKRPCRLILDERPYKVYTVKIATPPQLNYICFDEPQYVWEDHSELENNGGYIPDSIDHKVYTGETQRTYKGEGTIEFVCMSPYATEQFKVLDLYGDFNVELSYGNIVFVNNPNINPGNSIITYDNIDEWAESSAILSYNFYYENNVDKVCSTNGNMNPYNAYIPVYNAGDIDTPFYLFLPYKVAQGEGADGKGELNPATGDFIDLNLANHILRLEPFKSKTTWNKENGVIINTNNHLIEGAKYDYATSTWRTTGNLYNEYIVAGDFAKIKHNDWSAFDTYDGIHLQVIYLNCETALDASNNTPQQEAKIHYNYLYY